MRRARYTAGSFTVCGYAGFFKSFVLVSNLFINFAILKISNLQLRFGNILVFTTTKVVKNSHLCKGDDEVFLSEFMYQPELFIIY